jgi:preprotein translocase SecE subunit
LRFIIINDAMIKFFYDSLETLQKVKFATKKDYISLTLGVIVAIIVFGIFFVGIDTFFSWAYKTMYSIMRSNVSEWTTGQNVDSFDSNLVTWSQGIMTWDNNTPTTGL